MLVVSMSFQFECKLLIWIYAGRNYRLMNLDHTGIKILSTLGINEVWRKSTPEQRRTESFSEHRKNAKTYAHMHMNIGHPTQRRVVFTLTKHTPTKLWLLGQIVVYNYQWTWLPLDNFSFCVRTHESYLCCSCSILA